MEISREKIIEQRNKIRNNMDLDKWIIKLENDVASLMHAPADQTFTALFMLRHTRYESIYEFVDAYRASSEETLELIDEFVVRNTDFSTWENMNEAAISYRMSGKVPGED